jgi:hypothetical protein
VTTRRFFYLYGDAVGMGLAVVTGIVLCILIAVMVAAPIGA